MAVRVASAFVLLSLFLGLSIAAKERPLPQNIGGSLRNLYHHHRDHGQHSASESFSHVSLRKSDGGLEVALDVHVRGRMPLSTVLEGLRRVKCTLPDDDTWHVQEGVAAYCPIGAVPTVARLSGVMYITAPNRPHVSSAIGSAIGMLTANSLTRSFKGDGITIAVLSDSYDMANSRVTRRNNAADDVAQGFLPGTNNPFGRTTPVFVMRESASVGTDEGRAMLQLIHALAPNARLCFATANPTPLWFANTIIALAAPPCSADIIVDDILYTSEPVFSPGIVGAAVERVIASGVSYVTSAGNQNGESVVDDADFTSTSPPIPPSSLNALRQLPHVSSSPHTSQLSDVNTALSGCKRWHTWPNGDRLLPLNPSSNVNQYSVSFQLHWDEPYQYSASGYRYGQYNLFLIRTDPANNNANTYMAASSDPIYITRQPIQSIDLPLGTLNANRYKYSVAVCWTGVGSTISRLALQNPVFAYKLFSNSRKDSSVRGHGLGKLAVMVAAVSCTSGAPQYYTSAGPSLIRYGTDGALVDQCSDQFLRPTVAGCDGLATSFFGESNTFYGTSAAAPVVAALMGLILQRAGGRLAVSPRKMFNLVANTANGQGAFNAVLGYGVANIDRASSSLASAKEEGLSPYPPNPVTVTTLSTSEAKFDWSPSRCDGGSPLLQYVARLRRPDISLEEDFPVLPHDNLTVAVRGLRTGAAYSVTVRAVNSVGASAESDPMYFVAGAVAGQSLEAPAVSGSGSTLAIPVVVGAAGGGLVACAVIAALVIIFVRRARARRRSGSFSSAITLPAPTVSRSPNLPIQVPISNITFIGLPDRSSVSVPPSTTTTTSTTSTSTSISSSISRRNSFSQSLTSIYM